MFIETEIGVINFDHVESLSFPYKNQTHHGIDLQFTSGRILTLQFQDRARCDKEYQRLSELLETGP